MQYIRHQGILNLHLPPPPSPPMIHLVCTSNLLWYCGSCAKQVKETFMLYMKRQLLVGLRTGRQKEKDGKTFVCDKYDRAITYVKLQACRLLSSADILCKFTNYNI